MADVFRSDLYVVLSFLSLHLLTTPLPAEWQGDFDATLPMEFPSRKAALEYGCSEIQLRGPQDNSLYIARMTGQSAHVGFYETDAANRVSRFQMLLIPTWHGTHKAEALDLLGEGKDFLKIIFEGMSGTDCEHYILTLLEWREDEFYVVFLETIEYNLGVLGYYDRLRVEHTFEKQGTSEARIVLQYAYEHFEHGDRANVLDNGETEREKEIQANWRETLTWNPLNRSFYNLNSEKEKANGSFFFLPARISHIRFNYKDLRAESLLTRHAMRETGLFGLF